MTLDRHTLLDTRLRAAMRQDARITHALAYGSFTQGSSDEFSDLEYWVFHRPDLEFDVRAFLEPLTPVLHVVVNEFGTPTAILPGLLRVELHAVPNTQLSGVQDWPGGHIHPERMLVKDEDGELSRILVALALKRLNPAADAQGLLDRLLNWLAFGLNVLARGERLRALELLWWVQGGVLRLACLHAGHTEYWLNPSRLAEKRLPDALLKRYARMTAGLDGLEGAYAEALTWTVELAAGLELSASAALVAELRGLSAKLRLRYNSML